MDTPGIECSVKNQDVLFDMLTTWADRPCECMLKPLGVRACVCACVRVCVRGWVGACVRACVCVCVSGQSSVNESNLAESNILLA